MNFAVLSAATGPAALGHTVLSLSLSSPLCRESPFPSDALGDTFDDIVGSCLPNKLQADLSRAQVMVFPYIGEVSAAILLIPHHVIYCVSSCFSNMYVYWDVVDCSADAPWTCAGWTCAGPHCWPPEMTFIVRHDLSMLRRTHLLKRHVMYANQLLPTCCATFLIILALIGPEACRHRIGSLHVSMV